MLLLSENVREDHLIPGLVTLLRDLQVDANGFLREEAVATLFWSAEEFLLECASIREISKAEVAGILMMLEPKILEAMTAAGLQVLDDYFQSASGAVIHKQRKALT